MHVCVCDGLMPVLILDNDLGPVHAPNADLVAFSHPRDTTVECNTYISKYWSTVPLLIIGASNFGLSDD